MKKVMIILLLIVMTFPFCSFAEEENTSFYSGTWIATNSLDSPNYALGILHLKPDHTGLYGTESFDGAVRKNDYLVPITWKETENGFDVYVEDTLITQFDLLAMCYVGHKVENGKHIYFAKVYNINDVLNHGFTLHAGIYTVGKDLPAGDWRFEYQGTTFGEVTVYGSEAEYSAKYSFSDFDELLGMYTGQTIIGKLPLKEGNILVIQGDMFAMPVESLFP